jgi:TDG/mug DNA glycosylase family protein
MAETAPEDHSPSEALATFKGRLQLNNFMYQASEPAALPRRSPRFSVSPTKAIIKDSPTPASPSPAPKRKSSSASPAPSKKKRNRTPSGYAPPSKYAHLNGLPDAVAPNLLVFFVGLNPGIQTAVTGHAYAHPSNLFWKLLYSSGVTPRACRADEDRQMPELYSLGLTNIVGRPSRNGAELSKQEMDEGVAALEEKARRWRPECMCIVGKSIWESIWRVRHGSKVGNAFKYGWQDDSENMGVIPGEWAGARVFVASSTSGLAATLSPAEKQSIWNELGAWVKVRRAEREKESEVKAEPGEREPEVKAEPVGE